MSALEYPAMEAYRVTILVGKNLPLPYFELFHYPVWAVAAHQLLEYPKPKPLGGLYQAEWSPSTNLVKLNLNSLSIAPFLLHNPVQLSRL